jgi:hypothetical protein
VPKLFSGLRLKKEPPKAGISNNEQGTPNTEGRRRFAPIYIYKAKRAIGAPQL